MDAKRFTELFTDPIRWVHQARRLRMAADELTDSSTRALAAFIGDNHGRATQSAAFLNKAELFGALTDARALLYGLAIENACKARLIRTRTITVEDGRAKGLRTDHDVFAMVKDASYSPADDEAEFLRLLSYQVRVLTRYPIARDVDTQNRFTGRKVGARPEESQMVKEIVLKVLREKDLSDAFLHGHKEEYSI